MPIKINDKKPYKATHIFRLFYQSLALHADKINFNLI